MINDQEYTPIRFGKYSQPRSARKTVADMPSSYLVWLMETFEDHHDAHKALIAEEAIEEHNFREQTYSHWEYEK